MAMSAKCPPIPERSSLAEVARVLGISTGQVELRVRDGTFNKISAGEVNVSECIRNFVAAARREARRELDGEKVRQLRNQNERLEGQVIPTDTVEHAVLAFVQLVKDNVTGLAGRLASELAHTNEAPVVRARLREEIAAAFNAAYEALKPVVAAAGRAQARVGKPGDDASQEPG